MPAALFRGLDIAGLDAAVCRWRGLWGIRDVGLLLKRRLSRLVETDRSLRAFEGFDVQEARCSHGKHGVFVPLGVYSYLLQTS